MYIHMSVYIYAHKYLYSLKRVHSSNIISHKLQITVRSGAQQILLNSNLSSNPPPPI